MDRVADGVYQVKRGFRAFVVDGDEGVTLVDTGLPRAHGLVVKGLESIGRSVTGVVSIVLTHSHADHAGGASKLKQASGAAVYCAAADEAAVSRPPTRPSSRAARGGYWLRCSASSRLPARSTSITRSARDSG